MKKINITLMTMCLSVMFFTQSKGNDRGATIMRQPGNSNDAIRRMPDNKNIEAVKFVLKQYYDSIEKLDVSGTEKLFTADSKIFESGSVEGTYSHYMEHHLKPELKEFKSFKFYDYKVEVTVEGDFAFVTETYNYIITLAKDNTEVKRKGVATSVLKKVNKDWKILISHNSSRK